ncbi:MAG: DUF697 domain-containing protein [Methylococcaceae bacterium]|nr:DUF697 domain-containing protein [Methylococcaceae bacterium]
MATNDKANASDKEAPAAETIQGEDEALDLRFKRVDEAHTSVKNYTLAAMAVGLVPLPLVDMAALSAIQLKLVHSIANVYDVPFSKNIAKSIIGSVLGSSIAITLSMPVASFIKAIPLIGQSSGAVSTALIGSAATYAIGKIFVEHFESGGNFLDFDEEKAKAHFKSLYEEGRAFVSSHKAATS